MKQNGCNFTQNDYQWFEDYTVQRAIDKIRKTVEEEKRKTLLLLWIVLRKIGHPISINPLDWPERDDEWEIVSEIQTSGVGFWLQAILREPAGAVSNPAVVVPDRPKNDGADTNQARAMAMPPPRQEQSREEPENS